MRVVIVDDDALSARTAERTVKDFFTEREEAVEIKCCDGCVLLKELQAQNRYDIYFLDVEMPGMDGLELAEKIHNYDADARVVFLTSFDKYACQSYRIKAYYYITKDYFREELPRVLERVCEEEKESNREYYIISTETKFCKLKMNDILYLIKEKKYVFLYCTDGMIYKERRGMESIYQCLPQERFIIINRGIVVNIKYIVKYVKRELTMQDGKTFPVSRREGQVVRNKLEEYWGNLL